MRLGGRLLPLNPNRGVGDEEGDDGMIWSSFW